MRNKLILLLTVAFVTALTVPAAVNGTQGLLQSEYTQPSQDSETESCEDVSLNRKENFAEWDKNAVYTCNRIVSEMVDKHWKNIKVFKGVPDRYRDLFEHDLTAEEKEMYLYSVVGYVDMCTAEPIDMIVVVGFSEKELDGKILHIEYEPVFRGWEPEEENVIYDAYTEDFWACIFAY